ncbi:glutathione S-transferase family protein [Pseudahrensia aquimaris]|uniref:Glutathione S-transferase family protein n=1 Tax=Pseudahrensia aquimaris TaxID=744461 RepID=A0ABW3FH17_9HYPH
MTIKLYELCGAHDTLLFSPHCWKTRLSLAHKGLDFETVPVPFTQVASTEGEGRRVPIMRDGDTVVEDSFEIAKYLDEKHPDKPKLIGDEALTAFIINWTQTQLHPAVVQLCLMDIYNALAPEDQAFFRTTREKVFGMTLEEFHAKFPKTPDALNKALVPLELTLKKQDFIGGENPQFADYVAFGALQWLRIFTGDTFLPKDNNMARWLNALLDMYDGDGRKAQLAA